MTLLCITNSMPDSRSCTHKNQHTVRCDGNQYRWNADRNREEATGKPCNGCYPRLAQKGMLCWGCWENVQQAVTEWPGFETMIAGVERAVQRDNGGISSNTLGYVPIPGTVLAVEEIRSYLRTLTGNVDLWVATPAGAADAVKFAKAVSAAVRTHAVEEKAHKIKRTRCTKCGQLTLVWNPTPAHGGDVTVTCADIACRAVLPQSSFEKIANIERADLQDTVIIDAGQVRNERGDFAEPFDPTRPEHETLDPMSVLSMAELRTMAEPLRVPRINQMRKAELIDAIRAAQHPLEEIA